MFRFTACFSAKTAFLWLPTITGPDDLKAEEKGRVWVATAIGVEPAS
jgi:hypothetical protein